MATRIAALVRATRLAKRLVLDEDLAYGRYFAIVGGGNESDVIQAFLALQDASRAILEAMDAMSQVGYDDGTITRVFAIAGSLVVADTGSGSSQMELTRQSMV